MLRAMPLPDKPRAVVTGAGGGLGRAFCVELARRGARILASDVDLGAAEATAASVGAEAYALRCDVSRREDVAALAEEAERRLGGVDLIINNAGVATSGVIGDVSLEDWGWLLGVNLWGVIHGCHEFVPRLRRQGSGHVLNVASAAGLLSAPLMGPYNVSKAGVVALSETLAAELSGSGVGVTVLCPTFFKTNIAAASRGADAKQVAEIEKLMARSRLSAEDVARVALDGAAAGRLYVLPHADGRWYWRVKRAAPERFQKILGRLVRMRLPRVTGTDGARGR